MIPLIPLQHKLFLTFSRTMSRMAGPIPGEGLVEAVKDAPTSSRGLLWFAAVVVTILSFLMWLKDLCWESRTAREDRSAKRGDEKEKRKQEREDEREKWEKKREDDKEERKEKLELEYKKMGADKERWEAELKERHEIREHELRLKQLELELLRERRSVS